MKVNPVGKRLSEVERAYLAGFLDADGAIMATIEKHREKKFGWRVRVEIKVTQRDPRILRRFMNQSGRGNIRKNRTTFDWQIRGQADVREIINMIMPYLDTKREQARIAVCILAIPVQKYSDMKQVARLADSLARLNVRSEGRRKNFASMIQDYRSPND